MRVDWSSRSRLVEVEKEVVCRAHELGVLPLGGAVVAGDQAHAVQAMKVAECEGIPSFRLVWCTIGEREVPGRVLRPTMSFEERVLLGRRGWTSAHRLRTRYCRVSIRFRALATPLLFTEYLAMNPVCPRCSTWLVIACP